MTPDQEQQAREDFAATTSMLANAALGIAVDQAKEVVFAWKHGGGDQLDEELERLAEKLDSFDRAVSLMERCVWKAQEAAVFGWLKEAEYGRRLNDEGGETHG